MKTTTREYLQHTDYDEETDQDIETLAINHAAFPHVRSAWLQHEMDIRVAFDNLKKCQIGA